MTRRRIALLGLLVCALFVALVPWTVRSERVVDALARQVTQSYGIALASKGRLTLTLLPLPQLVLSGVRLASRDGSVEVEADEMRAQLRVLPLFQARLRLHKLWIAKSSIAVTLGEQPGPTAAGSLAALRGLLVAEHESRWVPRIDRFLLTEADIGFRDGMGREIGRLKRASLDLNSPEPDGDFGLTASGEWNGEMVVASLSGLNLAAIRGGLAHDIEGELAGRPGRLTVDGRLTWSERPQFTGAFKGQAASLARLARWSGIGTDLRGIERPFAVNAEGSLELDKLQWPRASVEFGRDRLDGAIALEFGTKPQIRATLAADQLDLGWLGRIVDPPGPDRLAASYDVRLSASALTLGPLKLREAALSVQCTPRGIEASLGRAVFAGGALRGRVSAALDSEGRDIRAQAWIEGIELEKALADISAARVANGTASGQLTLDATGDRADGIAKQLRGRGSLQTRDGEFALAAFSDTPRRGAQAAAPTEWRTGRIRFNQASVGVEFRDGLAELSNGTVETNASRAQVAGSVDLLSRNASLRLSVQPISPGVSPVPPPLILELNGPLQKLTVGAISSQASVPGTP